MKYSETFYGPRKAQTPAVIEIKRSYYLFLLQFKSTLQTTPYFINPSKAQRVLMSCNKTTSPELEDKNRFPSTLKMHFQNIIDFNLKPFRVCVALGSSFSSIFYTRETTFITSCLASCTQSLIWIGVYSLFRRKLPPFKVTYFPRT